MSIPGYQIFTKNRNTKGGGILTAVRHGFDSILVSELEIEEEILVVQVNLSPSFKVRIINAYAPQEDEAKEKEGTSFSLVLIRG